MAVDPATGDMQRKHAWAINRDGLIFVSGWYEQGRLTVGKPRAATGWVYVNPAANRYACLLHPIGQSPGAADKIDGDLVLVRPSDAVRVQRPSSSSTTWAALCPGAPVTSPPGCVPAPHR